MDTPRYRPLSLCEVEDLQAYRPGGLHPCSIGDTLGNGCYTILHKLGHGGASTVWLAQDSTSANGLVTLKVLASDSSQRPPRELLINRKLQEVFARSEHSQHVQLIDTNFVEKGPNGTHLCFVSKRRGPSVRSVNEFYSQHRKSKLRGSIARKIAGQVARVVQQLHGANIVHGDLTTSNMLFMLDNSAGHLSGRAVYDLLGSPVQEEVVPLPGFNVHPSAPAQATEAADITGLIPHLADEVVLSDFGQSMDIREAARDYNPATVLHYTPPEVRFASKHGPIGPASDIWMLACAIYEIRAGHSLFDSFLHSDSLIWMEIIETFGKLPQPWWDAFEPRHRWFEEDGTPKAALVQRGLGNSIISEESSLRSKVELIGDDEETAGGEILDALTEPAHVRPSAAEVDLLTDLLQQMLRYKPEDRITIHEVVRHPWFTYGVQ
ncbi:CMGC/SRPK protein kinase [Ephemerocybe angulata]|uniref:CMGC/SRPK protein kinase n=1 Tax=Ephemerocybe angulata TaxID=980116 RepID=A0A8H6M2G5_9AGAR|nr:CMGC/SRPK protein kinase [Tulosesus angulatus]